MSALAWREPFRAAFRSLWAHRLRSVLTTLGIIIGVASVIAVVHLTKSLEGRIMADVNKEGSHTFFLSPDMSNSAWKKGQKLRFQAITPEVMKEFRELVPEITLASPEYSTWGRNNFIKANGMRRRALIHAIDENGLELANLELACGRAFTPTDRITRAPVVILGHNVAKELELGPEHLGRAYTIAGQTVELIGILKKHGDLPFLPQGDSEESFGGTDNEVFIPFLALKELNNPRTLEFIYWRLQVDPRLSLTEAETLLKTNFRMVRGMRGDDPDNFLLETNRKQVEMVEKLSRTLLMASGAMVGISLLVGGIGVMNIMLVSVQERTREIGIRKALGARRRAILVQFLIEASLLCIIGGLIGLVLGAALGTTLSHLLMKHLASIPLWALASALGVPALVGLLFGLYPANRAAKLDPIEALRYE